MKVYTELIQYHLLTYRKTNRYIIPAILWLLTLVLLYRSGPSDIVGIPIITSVVLHFLMVWIGFSYFNSIDTVAEQIVVLKVQKRRSFYFSKYIFLLLAGFTLSFAGALYPVFVNILSDFTLFTRSITFQDIISSLILHIIFAAIGASISILFQPMWIKSRELSIILAVVLALMGIIKEGFVERMGLLKYIVWILPPTRNIVKQFLDQPYFSTRGILFTVLLGGIYSLALMVISQKIIEKRLY